MIKIKNLVAEVYEGKIIKVKETPSVFEEKSEFVKVTGDLEDEIEKNDAIVAEATQDWLEMDRE